MHCDTSKSARHESSSGCDYKRFCTQLRDAAQTVEIRYSFKAVVWSHIAVNVFV